MFFLLTRRTFWKEASGKKINSSLSEWPNNFRYLSILLSRNSVHLNVNAVSRKSKRKRTEHTKNVKYEIFKSDGKAFQKSVLSAQQLLCLILNSSVTDKPNPSRRHLFTRL